jgi:protein TonB
VAQAQVPWTVPKSDFGGATPINIRSWIRYQDYPSVAVAGGEQGYVVVGFDIDVKGRVTNCAVTKSSGYERLDRVPCPMLTKRARFKPATDAGGAPRTTSASTSMSFWTP